jgi:superfamily II DNA or RNA helicase
MTLLLPSSRDPFHLPWSASTDLLPEPPPPPWASGRGGARGGDSDDGEVEVIDVRDSMAFELLLDMVGRRVAPLPAEVLVAHVLAIHGGDGWVVQRAALEEILARVKAVRRTELTVASRPRGGQPFGTYRTRAEERGRAQPWETCILSLSPLRASCDCPDFLEESLGVCAHVLVALLDLASRPRAMQRAARMPAVEPVLDWDPVRPIAGDDAPCSRFSAASSAPSWSKDWVPGPGGRLCPPPMDEAAETRMLAHLSSWCESHEGEATPAARAVLATATREADAARRRASMLDDAIARLDSLRRPLYAYQREGVERFLRAGRLLLGDDMGLGKSAQAIAACHALHGVGVVRRTLLIVPAPLKRQWAREWRAFSDVPVRIVEGSPAERRAIYAAPACVGSGSVLIANYELLLRDLAALRAWGPDMVVLDEVQRIKNRETKTAAAVKALTPPYRLALTGTPLENRFDELASIMEWVDPAALSPAWRLRPVHGDVRDGAVVGLRTIRARIAPRFLRRRRAEVLSELPPRTDTFVSVELTAAQARPHQWLARSIAQLVKKSKRRPLTPAERLELMGLLNRQRIVANGLAQAEFESVWPTIERVAPSRHVLARLHTPKLDEMRALLASLVIDQGRTVVVFSQWLRMLRLVEWATRDLLTDAGVRSVFFTGKESNRARDRSVVELHDDPWTRVLFATDCAGVGLNLQRAASACINVELPWNPAVLEQRIGRIHRLGQRDPIDVVSLITESSIESRIASVIGAKRALFEGLFDSDLDAIELATEPTPFWHEAGAEAA